MPQPVTYALSPLLGQDVLTTAVTPLMGYINVYNASSGPLAPVLRQASLITLGLTCLVEKDPNDTSANAVTITCHSGETFFDGTTTRVLTNPGAFLVLEPVEDNAGVVRWKVVASGTTDTGALLDWAGGVAGVLPATSGQHLTTQGGNTLDDGSGNLTAVTVVDSTDVRFYGAKVDGKRRNDATILAGSLNTVRCASYNFTAADVGKTIIIGNGSTSVTGTGASSTANSTLITTIASISSNNAVLTTPAANAVSNAWVAWGTDDGAAWTAALTAAINGASAHNSYHARLTMPAGISICGQAISLAPSNSLEFFSLRGASVGASCIISTASGGFLTLDLTGTDHAGETSHVDIADLTLLAAKAGATTALTIEATCAGSEYQHRATLQNISCFGFDPLSGYWAYPIQVTGIWHPLLKDVIVSGMYPDWLSSPPASDYYSSDTSIRYLTSVGINLNMSYQPTLSRVWVMNTFRAVQCMSAVEAFPQGTYMDECVFFCNREGVYWQGTGPNLPPQVTIRGGHMNNRDFNICLDGWQAGILSHTMFYSLSFPPRTSTLAVAVPTGTNPTTLTLASTSSSTNTITGFPEAGAVQIGNEWFTYNNLTTGAPGSGMDGVTLHNVVRAQFGTVDPGSDYPIGATVHAAVPDVLLIGCNTIRLDNEEFQFDGNDTRRVHVMLHSGNSGCSVTNCRHDSETFAVMVGKDSTGTELLHNSYAAGMQGAALDGAADTIFRCAGNRSVRLVQTGTLAIASQASPAIDIPWSAADWDTPYFWNTHFWPGGPGTGYIQIPANQCIKRIRVTANVVFAANATGSRAIYIDKNGVYAGGFRSQVATDASFNTSLGTVCEINVVGGDQIRVGVNQDSGANLNIGAGTPSDTFFLVEVIEGV